MESVPPPSPCRKESGPAEAVSDELLTVLLEVTYSARGAYPALDVPTEIYMRYVLDRLPAGVPPLVALRSLHTSDLYLACGCALGDVRSVAVFEDRCLSHLERTLAKIGIDPALCADVMQDIRSRVLVGHRGHAEIVDFAGRGDLRGWIRVMSVRQALQRQARTRRELPTEDSELLQQLAVGDLALDHTKGIYRLEFKQAFERALHDLPDRDRTLLRQHHIDGLSIDELGRLYRVHRSTAARQLIRARLLVLEATRARLRSQLGVESRDLDSILRMIWSQVDISLGGLQRRRKR